MPEVPAPAMHAKSPILLVLAALAVLAGVWLALRGGETGAAQNGRPALLPDAGPGAAAAADASASGAKAGASSGSRSGVDAAPEEGSPSEDAAALAEDSDAPLLVGRVVGPAGDPVQDAAVHLRRSQYWLAVPADLEPADAIPGSSAHLEARTDEDGRFAFRSIEPGDWSLAVRAPGMAPFDRERQRVPRHERFDVGELLMSPGIVLEGRAVDASGAGLAGVRVLRGITPEGGSLRLALNGFGVPLGETGEGGAFRVDVLAPGAWHLFFESPRHRVAELTGTTAPAGERRSGLVARLEAGLPVAGRVEGVAGTPERPLRVTARMADEQPTGAAEGVQGVERHRPRHAEVAGDGSFAIGGLAPGVQYRVALARWEPAEEERPADPEVVAAPAGRWSVVRGVEARLAMAGEREVVLRYRPDASVALRAVDALTGEAVTRFSASLSGSGLFGGGLLESGGEPVLEHPGGSALFEGLRTPEEGVGVRLLVKAPGYVPLHGAEFLLRSGERKELGDLELRPAPSVVARVVEGTSGEPVAGARVLVARAAESEALERYLDARDGAPPWAEARVHFAETGEDGRARVTAWPDEVCVLRAIALDHVPSEEVRALPPHGESELELRFERAGSVRVSVRDPRGAPIGGIYVERRGADEGDRNRYRWDPALQARQTTDGSGLVLFEDLEPGPHEFLARQDGPEMRFGRGDEADAEVPRAEVRVRAGEQADVELVLPERGGFRAELLQGGEPLAGALAVMRAPGDDGRRRGFFRPGGQDPNRALSDHEGRVVFEGLASGWYVLVVTHPERRMSTELDAEVVASPTEKRIELGFPVIEGRVVGESGEALPSISVEVGTTRRERDPFGGDFRLSITEGEDGEADFDMEPIAQRAIETDAQGRYALRGVRPDEELVVRVRADHVVGDSRTIPPLSRDEVRRDVDFRLAAAGCLEVELTGIPQGSRERYQVAVRLQSDDGQVERSQGSLQSWRPRRTFCSLRPGRWTVDVWRGDDRANAATDEVEVVARETRKATLAAP